jgi:hypothetical protein
MAGVDWGRSLPFVLYSKFMKKMQICYHGTGRKEANSIINTGFNPGTYFSLHLEDALGFGGKYVFEVAFKTEELYIYSLGANWQFICKNRVTPKNIVSLKNYNETIEMFNNPKLRDKIFKSNLL